MSWNSTWTWIGGLISGIVALVALADQITFDPELLAAETRVAQLSDHSDRRIVEQLLSLQRLLIAQQRQQFLTLRKELLTDQIERLSDAYADAEADDMPLIGERLQRLESRLENVREQLQKSLLNQPEEQN